MIHRKSIVNSPDDRLRQFNRMPIPTIYTDIRNIVSSVKSISVSEDYIYQHPSIPNPYCIIRLYIPTSLHTKPLHYKTIYTTIPPYQTITVLQTTHSHNH